MAGDCLRVCAGVALLASLWACASPPPPRPLAFQVVSALRVEIPAELQPMDPPGVVETWWVSHEDEEQLRRGRSSTGYDDQVSAKITANLGFDTERGVFSDFRGNDEAALVRDPRRAGVATNVLFLYYTAADPNGRRADEVWSRFKAALLRSGGRS